MTFKPAAHPGIRTALQALIYCGLLAAGLAAQAQDLPEVATGTNPAAEPAPAAAEPKSETAIPVGLSEPLGPPTDPFNDTRTQGYVWGGLRFTPDVNLAYYYETNPTKVPENRPGDQALTKYATLTMSDAAGGPRKLFAGAAQTKWNHVGIGSDPRRVVTYQDRFSLAGWNFPVRLGYNSDVVSRSSFLARKINTELDVKVKTAGLDAIRTFDTTKLALSLRAGDVKIGSAATAAGQSFQSTNSNTNYLLRAKVTQPVSETTELYASAQFQTYHYQTDDVSFPINPSSDVKTVLVGVQRQITETFGLSADIGSARKTSGDEVKVPAANHGVGSVKASFVPAAGTDFFAAYIAGVEELNDEGVSNLKTGTISLGLSHKLTPSLVTTLSYDRTRIATNELQGNVVDSKFFAALLWKPHPKVLTALAFSRTRREVTDLQDFVKPFSNNRYLINFTYYL
jgi:hypothetical protein